MKARDLINLLKNFERTGINNGDLVITAEIHRVVDKDWSKKHLSAGGDVEVVTIWPECSVCAPKECCHSRIMRMGGAYAGQQAVMKLAKKKS